MRKINICSVFFIFLSMGCVSEEEININGYEILSLNGKKCHSKYLTKNIDKVMVYRDNFSRDESNTQGQLLNPEKNYLIIISTSVEKGLIEKGYTIPTEEILECVNEDSKVVSSLIVEEDDPSNEPTTKFFVEDLNTSTKSSNGFTCSDNECLTNLSYENSYFVDEEELNNYININNGTAIVPTDSFPSIIESESYKEFLRVREIHGNNFIVTGVAVLEDVGLKIEDLANIEEEAGRNEWIENRKASLNTSQTALIFNLSQYDTQIRKRMWLINGVIFDFNIKDLEKIASIDGIKILASGHSYENSNQQPSTSALLDDNIEGLLVDRLQISGFNGSKSSRRFRIGVIETGKTGPVGSEVDNRINCWHYGFKKGNLNESRVIKSYNCGGFSCSNESCSSADTTHSTWVSSVAIGNIKNGQDPNVTNTYDRENRSGIASEGAVYYYRTSNNFLTSACSKITAIEKAVEDDVDVINMSFRMQGAYGIEDDKYKCDHRWDPCSMNQAMYNASKAGTVLVAATGNNVPELVEPGESLTKPITTIFGTVQCGTAYPASHHSVIAVGGSNKTFPYHHKKLDYQSLYGISTAQYGTINSNEKHRINLVDFLTPYHWSYLYGKNQTYEIFSRGGTSFSAPAASGIILLMLDWMNKKSWTGTNLPWMFRSILLASSDGANNYGNIVYDSYEYPPNSGRYEEETNAVISSLSPKEGAGRLRSIYPYDQDIKHWRTRFGTITSGQRIEWPISLNQSNLVPSSYAGLKSALVIVPSSNQHVGKMPNVNLQIINKCGPGGKETIVEKAGTSDPLKRILFMRDYININTGSLVKPLENKCIWIRITGTGIDRGKKINFAATSYAYNTYSPRVLHRSTPLLETKHIP